MQKTIYTHTFPTVFGELLLGDFEDQLCICDWKYRKMRTGVDQRIQKGLNAFFEEKETDLHKQTMLQLTDYFTGNLTHFTLPLLFVGTDFQKTVWTALQKIPYGETYSYLALAKKMANEKAIRAIASANGANALSIIVPCHRIIGSDGSLVGYAGGISTKSKLLKLENNTDIQLILDL